MMVVVSQWQPSQACKPNSPSLRASAPHHCLGRLRPGPAAEQFSPSAHGLSYKPGTNRGCTASSSPVLAPSHPRKRSQKYNSVVACMQW